MSNRSSPPDTRASRTWGAPHTAAPALALPPLVPACVAEGIGTFGLVFAGCGAIMTDRLSGGQVTHVGVGLVFGLVIAAMIYATGHLSGAHFNPAVTLGFVLARHFPVRRLLGYWAAQLVGDVGGDERFGHVMQARKRNMLAAGAQCGDCAVHRGMAQHSFESLADCRKDHSRKFRILRETPGRRRESFSIFLSWSNRARRAPIQHALQPPQLLRGRRFYLPPNRRL